MYPCLHPENKKTVRFFDVFRGQRKYALGKNGLRYFLWMLYDNNDKILALGYSEIF